MPTTADITLDHIRAAAEWARDAANEPKPIDGQTRKYNQGQWDCGTSCCMWGAASLLAGCGPASGPPPEDWLSDHVHVAVNGLLCSGMTRPEQMLALLDSADLTGADLTDADLAGAYLAGAHIWVGGTKLYLSRTPAATAKE
jgi:hypothetical protein